MVHGMALLIHGATEQSNSEHYMVKVDEAMTGFLPKAFRLFLQ